MQKNFNGNFVCGGSRSDRLHSTGAEETQELSQQEKEVAAVAEWFSESMTDEEDFPDIKDYIGHI